jgi:hypothetical protein
MPSSKSGSGGSATSADGGVCDDGPAKLARLFALPAFVGVGLAVAAGGDTFGDTFEVSGDGAGAAGGTATDAEGGEATAG